MLKFAKRALSPSYVASLALLSLFGCAAEAAKKTPAPAPASTNPVGDDSSYPSDTTPTTSTTTPLLDLPGAVTQVAHGSSKIVGITNDDQLIYIQLNPVLPDQLMTVPMTGGTPTVLVPTFTRATSMAMVSGGAVGIWTDISNHRGTFSLWTRTTGLRQNLTNAHDSVPGVFAATTDGTRVAFSVDAPSSLETNLAVATSTSVTLTTQGIFDQSSLIDTASMRDSSPACAPQIRFAQRALISAHCVGESESSTLARLYWLGDGQTLPVRLDTLGQATGSVKPFWFSDTNGTKIYAVSASGNEQARIVTTPLNGQAATSVGLDNDAASAGFITNDGQTVVYRTPELGLRRASTSSSPNPQTLVPGVRTILDISTDLTKVLVHTLDSNGSFRDIRDADILTVNQTPHDIVPTATVEPLGFTGDSQWVLYLSGVSGSSNQLTAQASMGGSAKTIAQNITDVIFPEGSPGVVVQTDDNEGTFTITYANASSGHVSPVLGTQVPSEADGGLASKNHKMAWVSNSTSNPGVFIAQIP